MLGIYITRIGIRVVNRYDDWGMDLDVKHAEEFANDILKLVDRWQKAEKEAEEDEVVIDTIRRLGWSNLP